MRCFRLERRLQPVRQGRSDSHNSARRTHALVGAALALLLALGSQVACVQGQGVRLRVPAFSVGWKLVVGSGAEYRATCGSPGASPDPTDTGRALLDLAIVGEQRVGKRTGYWLELSSRPDRNRPPFIVKALFFREPGRVVFVRAITQLPGRPPMTLPADWLYPWVRGVTAAAVGFIEPYARNPYSHGGSWALYPLGFFDVQRGILELPKAKELRQETVTAPAGTFACRRWRMHASVTPWLLQSGRVDVWLAGGAGPFSLVKATMRVKGGIGGLRSPSRMLLVRVLTNAPDKIAGKPLRSQPDKLWYWIWEQRAQGKPEPCLPQLGLPTAGAPG